MPIRWMIGLGGFALAFFLSWRGTQASESSDLRTPAILLLNASLAMGVALGYALDRGALALPGASAFCVLYGLWSAAAFRLVPPTLDLVLFFSSAGSSGPNWPAGLVLIGIGAGFHGGIVLLMTWPYARRVLGEQSRALWDEEAPALRLIATTVLVFYIAAAIARAVAGLRG